MERLIEKLMAMLGIWDPVVDISENHDQRSNFVADIGEGEGSDGSGGDGGDSGGDS